MNKTVQRPLKSISLTEQDLVAVGTLKSKEEYSTQERLATVVGLTRPTLNRMVELGRGSQLNVTKLRKALKKLGAYTVD